MKNNDDIPTTDTTEIKQLINRVIRGELSQGDALLIEKLLDFLLTIVSLLQRKHTSIRRIEKLTRFLSAPGAPIDNNEAERVLKRFVLFRKNSLFYKTEHGAAVV